MSVRRMKTREELLAQLIVTREADQDVRLRRAMARHVQV